MEEAKVSIILLNNNEDNLLNCLNSINKQKYSKENIEVILETLKLNEEVKEELNKYKFKLLIKEVKELETASCYNDALKEATGDYIMFTNSNMSFDTDDAFSYINSQDTLDNEVSSNMEETLEKSEADSDDTSSNELEKVVDNVSNSGNSNLLAYKVRFYDSDLNEYTDYVLAVKSNEKYSLEKNSGEIELCLEGYFINRKILKGMKFDSTFNEECRQKLLLDLLIKNPSFICNDNISITTISPLEDNFAKNSIQYDPRWYNESLVNWTKYLSELDYVPVYIQEAVLYMLYAKINCNIEDRDKYVLDDEEYKLVQDSVMKKVYSLF